MKVFIPKGISEEVSYGCNMNCSHCFSYATYRSGYVNLDDFKRTHTKVLEHCYFPVLQMSGGEPLLHPDLIELIKFAATLYPEITVWTNGTLLTKVSEELLQTLSDFNVCLMVSVKAYNEQSVAPFAEAVSGIERALYYKVPVKVRHTPLIASWSHNPQTKLYIPDPVPFEGKDAEFNRCRCEVYTKGSVYKAGTRLYRCYLPQVFYAVPDAAVGNWRSVKYNSKYYIDIAAVKDNKEIQDFLNDDKHYPCEFCNGFVSRKGGQTRLLEPYFKELLPEEFVDFTAEDMEVFYGNLKMIRQGGMVHDKFYILERLFRTQRANQEVQYVSQPASLIPNHDPKFEPELDQEPEVKQVLPVSQPALNAMPDNQEQDDVLSKLKSLVEGNKPPEPEPAFEPITAPPVYEQKVDTGYLNKLISARRADTVHRAGVHIPSHIARTVDPEAAQNLPIPVIEDKHVLDISGNIDPEQKAAMDAAADVVMNDTGIFAMVPAPAPPVIDKPLSDEEIIFGTLLDKPVVVRPSNRIAVSPLVQDNTTVTEGTAVIPGNTAQTEQVVVLNNTGELMLVLYTKEEEEEENSELADAVKAAIKNKNRKKK